MADDANKVYIDIYEAEASLFGDVMKQAIATGLPDMEKSLAGKFLGAKIELIGNSGGLLKIAVSSGTNNPDEVNKARFKSGYHSDTVLAGCLSATWAKC